MSDKEIDAAFNEWLKETDISDYVEGNAPERVFKAGHSNGVKSTQARFPEIGKYHKLQQQLAEKDKEIAGLIEEKFQTNLTYLDLVELVRYHSESIYEKIFLHEKPNLIKLMIDRVVTNEEYEKLDAVYMFKAIEKLQQQLTEKDKEIASLIASGLSLDKLNNKYEEEIEKLQKEIKQLKQAAEINKVNYSKLVECLEIYALFGKNNRAKTCLDEIKEQE